MLVLFAGGIGITPCMAMLKELGHRAQVPGSGPLPPSLRAVHLVWVIREAELLEAFADALAALPAGLFTLHLFCTQGGKGSSLAAGSGSAGKRDPSPVEAGWCSADSASAMAARLQQGRPNISELLGSLVGQARSSSGPGFDAQAQVTAFVCGPEAMVQQVSEAAFLHGTGFHSEVFHF